MNKLLKLFFIFFVSFHLSLSFGCDRSSVQLHSFTPNIVDFNLGSSQVVSFTVTHNAPTTNCLYFIVFDYGLGSSWTDRELQLDPGNTIPFNIFRSTPTSALNILRDQPDVTSINHIVYWPIFNATSSSTTNNHSFVAELGALPTGLASGTYIGPLTAKVIATPFGTSSGSIYTWPSIAETSIVFRYSNEPELNLSLVNTGATFDSFDIFQHIGFDKLESGEQQTFDAVVETNVGYRLSISSENNGNLRNPTTGSTINYIFESGAPFVTQNLTSSSTTPLEIDSNVGPNHPAGGYRVPIRISTGTLTGSELSGSYSDTITFTLTAF